jgi:large subunit ribosomal protein L3
MGYKAGMTQIFMIEDTPGSPNLGKEVIHAATIIDAPPITVCAIRAYIENKYGLQSFSEAWMKKPPTDFERRLVLPEQFDTQKGLETIENNLEQIVEIRLLTATQPRLARVPRKTPEIMEIKVDGGSLKDQFEYSKNLLGKTVLATDILKEGQFVDVISVSKGKGWQGPVKRWGIKILPRKSRKTKRGVAAIGPWKPPRVLYTVPRAGQMGYHQRTEYNKRILKIGIHGDEISPKGGFLRYGPLKGTYILVAGSLCGPPKRLVRLRYSLRPPTRVAESPPNITHISLESAQR